MRSKSIFLVVYIFNPPYIFDLEIIETFSSNSSRSKAAFAFVPFTITGLAA
jgi:hypothetical protein